MALNTTVGRFCHATGKSDEKKSALRELKPAPVAFGVCEGGASAATDALKPTQSVRTQIKRIGRAYIRIEIRTFSGAQLLLRVSPNGGIFFWHDLGITGFDFSFARVRGVDEAWHRHISPEHRAGLRQHLWQCL